MATLLQNNIEKGSSFFTKRDPYLTLTRKNGREIITVANKIITITNLQGEPRSRDLVAEVPFEPEAMVMNESEECLCLYNQAACAITYLKPLGSDISCNTLTNIDFKGDKKNKLLQVVFNNSSKFQSEIVLLTSLSIQTFDINYSPKTPVQVYPFTAETKFSASFSTDQSIDIIDPVSITFGSSFNAKADLTLFLLTADASLYSIYPFFPRQLSKDKEWFSEFSIFNSILLQSADSTDAYSKYVNSFKVATRLENSWNNCIVAEVLPESYQMGKISGPLSINPFPDELYAYDAKAILPLKDDILAIVFDHCVATISYDSSNTMIFEGQGFNSSDSFLMIDAQIIDSKYGEIASAYSHPVTQDSLLVITKKENAFKLFQIDYSKWLNVLVEEDDDTISKILHGSIPTVLLHLDDITVPLKTSNIKSASQTALAGANNEEVNENIDIDQLLYNKLWFIWNSKALFVVSLNKDGVNTSLVSTSVEPEENEVLTKEDQTKGIDIEISQDKLYKPIVTTLSSSTLIPEIQRSQLILSNLKQALVEVKPRVLNLDTANGDDLKEVLNVADIVTKGQLILFRCLSSLSTKLRALSLEYNQQINGLHILRSKKNEALMVCKKNKKRFETVLEKQLELQKKCGEISASIGELYNASRCNYLVISKEEREYFAELQSIDSLVKERSKQEEDIRSIISQVENAELDSILKNSSCVLDNPQSQLKMQVLKKNLEDKGQFIDYLTTVMDNIRI